MLDESLLRPCLSFEKKNNHAELTMEKKRKTRETPVGFLFHRSEEQTYAHAARRNCRLTIVARCKEEEEVKARKRRKKRMSWAQCEYSFSLSNYVSLLYLLFIYIYIFLRFVSYSFVRLLMVKCLLRQVARWSSSPSPICRSLSKPYNCSCSSTYTHRHKRCTLISVRVHTKANRPMHWPLDHRRLKYLVILFACVCRDNEKWKWNARE